MNINTGVAAKIFLFESLIIMKASLIFPCYNESASLHDLIGMCKKIASSELEIVLVDNGSTDNSYELMNELVSVVDYIKIVHIKENIGYGHGIIQGLKNAQGEILAWTHADLQTDPNDIIRGLKYFTNNKTSKNILVKGSRQGRPLLDNIFSIGLTVFESILLFRVMSEINAQPTIFHRSFFETWKNPPDDYFLDLYVYYYAKLKNLTILKFSVAFPPRKYGGSHWNFSVKSKLFFIFDIVKYSLRLKKIMSKA